MATYSFLSSSSVLVFLPCILPCAFHFPLDRIVDVVAEYPSYIEMGFNPMNDILFISLLPCPQQLGDSRLQRSGSHYPNCPLSVGLLSSLCPLSILILILLVPVSYYSFSLSFSLTLLFSLSFSISEPCHINCIDRLTVILIAFPLW